MTLSELLIEYRTEHNLSQRQFAIQCGVSNGYIAMLEKNLNPKTGQPMVPTIPSLMKIASGMGMTLSELFAAVEDMPVALSYEDEKKPATDDDDGLDLEIAKIILSLSEGRKREALRYLRYLATQEEN